MAGGAERERNLIKRLLAEESLDLYLLAAAAAVLTLFGVLGVSDSSALLSGILAVLAWLAISQIRLRNMIGKIAGRGSIAAAFFELELDEVTSTALAGGSDLFITGVARNGLTARYYSLLESRLASGTKIRFMVMNPDSPSLAVAAVRYYSTSGRSVSTLKNRIEETLARLSELREAYPDGLQVYVSNEPLAIGLIAVNASRRDKQTRAIVEYYTYQAPGEPKFVLDSADEPWLSHFLDEGEAYWNTAVEWLPPPSA